ncbi:MAG: hypothetical protein K6C08_08445 [Oscillospiraceae bacterium]|nr:hypothetical protein [Oscillospiraceae bacterium]
MKAKIWVISWLIVVVSALGVSGYWVYKVDPFFHYHKPDLENYYYILDNQRSQNDGIVKHFNYDALITGTSMTENFKTTEADRLFGFHSIKVTYSGGSYEEINKIVETALKANPDLRTIIRGLDMGSFLSAKKSIKLKAGKYPEYLYDSNPFNDVEYLFNRDVLFGRVYQMTIDNDKEDFKAGIRSFDDYSRWQEAYIFGINTFLPGGIIDEEKEQSHLTESEERTIKENITLYVTDVADKYPDVDFYYFYPPYSAVDWYFWKADGVLYKMMEAESFVTELIVPHKNIKLFSFNARTDITTDLNNYKDGAHYGCWINSLILKWMHDGKYQLTEYNFEEILKQEHDFYTTFDYNRLNGQEDYESDFYAAALLNEELTGAKPLDILNDDKIEISVNEAQYRIDDNGTITIDCYGSSAKDCETDVPSEYIKSNENIGIRFNADLDEGYNYLCFKGQKNTDHGQLTVYVYDSDGRVVGQLEEYSDIDNEKHQYVLDLSDVSGDVMVVLNGGYTDCTESPDSNYRFSEIYMY